jgi:cytidine deaminase
MIPKPNDVERLIACAQDAQKTAYAPYSKYQVGAAVLTEEGKIYQGGNIENAVYPLTTCAERVAITKAVSEGARKIIAIAVVTENGGSPCGSCRQIMREFGDDDLQVYIAKVDGNHTLYTLDQLLPDSFSAQDLESS